MTSSSPPSLPEKMGSQSFSSHAFEAIMHPMAKHEEYDWLNDPFDEKKIAEEQEQAKMSGCSRMGVLIAAIVVIVILVLFAFVSCSVLTLGA